MRAQHDHLVGKLCTPAHSQHISKALILAVIDLLERRVTHVNEFIVYIIGRACQGRRQLVMTFADDIGQVFDVGLEPDCSSPLGIIGVGKSPVNR